MKRLWSAGADSPNDLRPAVTERTRSERVLAREESGKPLALGISPTAAGFAVFVIETRKGNDGPEAVRAEYCSANGANEVTDYV